MFGEWFDTTQYSELLSYLTDSRCSVFCYSELLPRDLQKRGRAPLEAAASLRASPLDAFFTVVLPLSKRGFLTAVVLSFAHTVGEFGVVLMIGGAIPGETKVLSVTIYEYVETLRWAEAHVLAGGLLVFSFLVIAIMMTVEKRLGRSGA